MFVVVVVFHTMITGHCKVKKVYSYKTKIEKSKFFAVSFCQYTYTKTIDININNLFELKQFSLKIQCYENYASP